MSPIVRVFRIFKWEVTMNMDKAEERIICAHINLTVVKALFDDKRCSF